MQPIIFGFDEALAEFTSLIPCHSLHEHHKPLNINYSSFNVLIFTIPLMSLDYKFIQRPCRQDFYLQITSLDCSLLIKGYNLAFLASCKRGRVRRHCALRYLSYNIWMEPYFPSKKEGFYIYFPCSEGKFVLLKPIALNWFTWFCVKLGATKAL